MLTIEDCLGLCDLDEEESLAIAKHEHLPEIIAVELAQYLIENEDGVPVIRKMILEDIQVAREGGDEEQVQRLNLVLKHFVATHPASPYRESIAEARAAGDG